MNFITEVLVANTLKDLESMIEEKLHQGWERVGDLKTVKDVYLQVMIIKSEKLKKEK